MEDFIFLLASTQSGKNRNIVRGEGGSYCFFFLIINQNLKLLVSYSKGSSMGGAYDWSKEFESEI